jgi:hypothetical protein
MKLYNACFLGRRQNIFTYLFNVTLISVALRNTKTKVGYIL